ncbi:hypothetical protein [Kineococcus sp. SYSU DK001]|uniref:hypothetical protein n=1 Tax=Kineococcus sp. SYSU DK001 TaxID=3383122 RepID=UPI003D7EB81E
MRAATVLPLLALALTLGACGTQPASPVPTGGPTTSASEWTPSSEEIAHQEWLQGGPLATSMPTRTCTWHEPTEEERAATDPDDPFASSDLSWTSCFDASAFQTVSTCTPPPDVPEGGSYLCVELPWLTQRVVDDWDAFTLAEDTAAARAWGLTLEEYRAQRPDQHADGSPVQAP